VTVRILEDDDEHENEDDFSTSEFRFRRKRLAWRSGPTSIIDDSSSSMLEDDRKPGSSPLSRFLHRFPERASREHIADSKEKCQSSPNAL